MERKEVMDLGSGEPKEIMDLISGKPMETIGLGSGELEDYPFVRRLRNRRLLVYLWLQGFDAAYDRLHLRQLVVWGRWSEALDYISRFLPPVLNDWSLDARSLLFFLHTLWALANVAACSTGGLVNDSVHSDLSFLGTLSSTNAKLSSILRYTLHSPQFRESLDWMLVRKKASLIVDDWALETPELRRKMQLPGGPGLPRDLLPIGPLCPRRHRREQSRRAKASTIAKSYLNRKRSLPPTSPHPAGLPKDALRRVADLIEGCLRAGKLLELHQGCPLQSNAKGGASDTPLLQTMFGTVTNPAKNTGTSSVTNAGPIKHSRKDGCYSNSAGQGSVGRKKREDLMTEEDDPDRKRQRTELELLTEVEAGSCGQLLTEVEAGSCGANLMAN
ncbi:hypothetical protein CFC21_025305 [Triticum aestivum]|uniref:Uncharacterized protein n=3 Tax=Triticum TaxID=4564 RepID=A0A9R1RS22_TRITD|nr:hypothetical protein CFC21_025305 [Triticum aestivum]VAH51663.1 unnamed protein product [Triticum turgidum subsp. durum]